MVGQGTGTREVGVNWVEGAKWISRLLKSPHTKHTRPDLDTGVSYKIRL